MYEYLYVLYLICPDPGLQWRNLLAVCRQIKQDKSRARKKDSRRGSKRGKKWREEKER